MRSGLLYRGGVQPKHRWGKASVDEQALKHPQSTEISLISLEKSASSTRSADLQREGQFGPDFGQECPENVCEFPVKKIFKKVLAGSRRYDNLVTFFTAGTVKTNC